jgi:hypothetical protein
MYTGIVPACLYSTAMRLQVFQSLMQPCSHTCQALLSSVFPLDNVCFVLTPVIPKLLPAVAMVHSGPCLP